jgi:hypothetical protein
MASNNNNRAEEKEGTYIQGGSEKEKRKRIRKESQKRPLVAQFV